jgi:hypothetical protein
MYFLCNKTVLPLITYTHFLFGNPESTVLFISISRTNRTSLLTEPTFLLSLPSLAMDPARSLQPPPRDEMHRTSRTYLPERCSLEEEPSWSMQSAKVALAAPFVEEALVAPSAGPDEMLFEAAPSAKSAQSARVALAAPFAEDALVTPSAGPEEMLADAAPSTKLGEEVLAEVAFTRAANAAPTVALGEEVTLDSAASPALPVTTMDVVSENVTTPMDAGSSPTTIDLVRSLLPNISSPTVQYNLPVLPVQR